MISALLYAGGLPEDYLPVHKCKTVIMKQPKSSLVLTLFCALLLVLAGKSSSLFGAVPQLTFQESFNYQERVGDSKRFFTWRAEENSDGVTIIVDDLKRCFHNYCSSDGTTTSWHYSVEGKDNIIVVRVGDRLVFSGYYDGENLEKEVKIDGRPWYQPLSFSLGEFLDSDKQTTSFWVVRSDTLEVIAMTAKKKGEEQLLLGSTTVAAQQVEIRTKGLLSKFWSARYWYRKNDNLFLRYQSVHGLPGTAETVVELMNIP